MWWSDWCRRAWCSPCLRGCTGSLFFRLATRGGLGYWPFFADDFSYYWFHRTSHECRFFWASHVVHHSSQHYNLSTALRQTWTGGFFGFVFWLWMPLVGFQPIMIFTMQAVSLLYQFWIHTEFVQAPRAAGAGDEHAFAPSRASCAPIRSTSIAIMREY